MVRVGIVDIPPAKTGAVGHSEPARTRNVKRFTVRQQPCDRKGAIFFDLWLKRIAADPKEPTAAGGDGFVVMNRHIRHALVRDFLPGLFAQPVETLRPSRPELAAKADQTIDRLAHFRELNQLTLVQSGNAVSVPNKNLPVQHSDRSERFGGSDFFAGFLKKHVIWRRLP